MDNPWKRKSRVNPQKEDGHREIENKLFRALIKQRMAGSEWAVCMAVIDRTFGFQKTWDKISYGQLMQATDLTRQAVIDAVKSLEARHILVVNHCRPINQILFNKHYDTWLVNRGRLVNRCRPPWSTTVDQKWSTIVDPQKKERNSYKRKYTIIAQKIFEEYPKQRGGPQAIRNIVSLLRKGEPDEKLSVAVENYKREIKDRDIPHDRIYYGYNFFGRAAHWRDYINPEVGEDEKSLRDFREYQKEIRPEKGTPRGIAGKTPRPD